MCRAQKTQHIPMRSYARGRVLSPQEPAARPWREACRCDGSGGRTAISEAAHARSRISPPPTCIKDNVNERELVFKPAGSAQPCTA
jgi:hypothetical protein